LNFALELSESLVFGLQIVGGVSVPDNREIRLTDSYIWTSTLIKGYVDAQTAKKRVGRVVVAAHADPVEFHDPFFVPFRDFIASDLQNQTPILYLNGDDHEWNYEPNFYGQPAFLRITLSGKGREPPTIIQINESGIDLPTDEAFLYNRNFPKCNYLLFHEGIQVRKYSYSKLLGSTICRNSCMELAEFLIDPKRYIFGSCP